MKLEVRLSFQFFFACGTRLCKKKRKKKEHLLSYSQFDGTYDKKHHIIPWFEQKKNTYSKKTL
jgi:hypothetical protein